MKKILDCLFVAFLWQSFMTSVIWASVEIPDHITVDMTEIGQLAGIILAILALMWGLRKMIKTINRS